MSDKVWIDLHPAEGGQRKFDRRVMSVKCLLGSCIAIKKGGTPTTVSAGETFADGTVAGLALAPASSTATVEVTFADTPTSS